MTTPPDTNDQAPDENRAPGQQTPSRGYGRQVHEDGTHQDVEDASAAEQTTEPDEDTVDSQDNPDAQAER